MQINVVGAGLAGCEAAWQLAKGGVSVTLYEMKPEKQTPAHSSDLFAELVCSNSLKAQRLGSAAGLLKEEMRRMGSLLIPCAEATSVPAGGALAVDRERFSALVTEKILGTPAITVSHREITQLPENELTVIATGPLTADALAAEISTHCGAPLRFYDAVAPIVTAASIDMNKAFFAARYDRGEDDYINCPMNKEEYEAFHEALIGAEGARLHDFDTPEHPLYEGCMPVELLAKRGKDAIRFGPLKPVGLRDPRTGHRPWAVVQLRKENTAGALYNLVGFQTNLRFPEQKRVFSMIPGLENAEFMRYGVMHRNTFLNSPCCLDTGFFLKGRENIAFAGQILGVEGYIESAMSGIVAGQNILRRLKGLSPLMPPAGTMSGELCRHVLTENSHFQPMGCNMGLLPPLPERVRDKQERYTQVANKALTCLEPYLQEIL